MRVLTFPGMVLAAALVTPQTADAKIAFLRCTIVEVKVGEVRGELFGEMVFARTSPPNKKGQKITARVNKRLHVEVAGRLPGRRITWKDLKPGMAVEVVISGNRVGDTAWYVDRIRVLEEALIPSFPKK